MSLIIADIFLHYNRRIIIKKIQMKTNKEKSNKINTIFSKTFVIYAGSNLSLYLSGCFIDKYKIQNYKIIFTGQGGKRNKKKEDLKFICEKSNIDIAKCFLIDQNLNYNYIKMFFQKNKIINDLDDFIKDKDISYVTSFNYGLVNSLLKNKFNKELDYLILEDGIDNWIPVKNKLYIFKSILYSITLRKLIFLSKFRINIGEKIITSLKNKRYYNSDKIIDISDQFLNLAKDFSKEKIIGKNNEKNILIICARTDRYKNGIENFLYNVKKNFLKQNTHFIEGDIKFYYKLHPGYTLENSSIKLKNFILIENDNIPVEFFNLNNISFILSPANTSIIFIKELNTVNNKIINFYDIYQSDYEKKVKLVKKYNINQFNNNKYSY